MFPLMLHFQMKSHAANHCYVLPHLSKTPDTYLIKSHTPVTLGKSNLLPLSFRDFFLLLVFMDLCDFISSLSHSMESV